MIATNITKCNSLERPGAIYVITTQKYRSEFVKFHLGDPLYAKALQPAHSTGRPGGNIVTSATERWFATLRSITTSTPRQTDVRTHT